MTPAGFLPNAPGKAPDIVPASSCGNRRSQRTLESQRTGGPRNLSRSEHLVLLAKDQSYVSGPSWRYCTCSELMLRCCPDVQGQGTDWVFLWGFHCSSSHLVQFYRSPLLIGNLLNKRTVHSYVPMFLLNSQYILKRKDQGATDLRAAVNLERKSCVCLLWGPDGLHPCRMGSRGSFWPHLSIPITAEQVSVAGAVCTRLTKTRNSCHTGLASKPQERLPLAIPGDPADAVN